MDSHNTQAFFAKRFKMLREERGLSQGDLAKALGVSRGSISYYENAERTADIDFAYKAAVYFGTSVDYLLGKSDLCVTNADAFDTAKFTGLSDKTALLLKALKENADTNQQIFKVLDLLIEQSPPPPSPNDFMLHSSCDGEFDHLAYSEACHSWQTSHTHVLNKISQYLFHNPINNKPMSGTDFGFGADGVINDYGFMSQVYLNVVQESIQQLKKLIE